MLRYFELSDTKSSKFWEIRFDEHVVTVRYGRIGTNGQTVSKPFADSESASTHVAKLVAEKLGKGYVERTEGHAGTDTKTTAAGANSEGAGRELSAADVEPPAKVSPRRGRSAVIDLEAMPSQLEQLIDKDDVTNRLLAKHPHASGSMLERLSHSSDKVTRQCVVLHPNSPKEVLLRLAPQFPGDFIRNPAFDWLLLEDPDLLFRLGQGVLKNILKRPDCPASFVDWAAKHGSDQEMLAVVMNAATPLEIVQLLASKGGPLAEAAAGRLQAIANADPADSAGDLDATFEAALRDSLAAMDSEDAAVAWKKGFIGAGQWSCLSLDGQLRVLGFSPAAVLPKLIADHAAGLAQDRSPRIREYVARDPGTPTEVVISLLADVDAAVKDAAERRLAGVKPDLTAAIASPDWEAVLDKGNAQSRQELAAHPLAPADVLERVSKKASPTIWKALAYNPACPEGLRQSAWDNVAAAAGPKILDGMVLNPVAPAGLRMRASERIWWSEFDVSIHSLRPEIRKRIHQAYGDRKHLFVPPSVQQIRELHGALCVALFNDPSTSLLADLLGAKESFVTALDPDLVAGGCRSSFLPVRLLALAHRDAHPAELVKASNAIEWQVRLAIARNSSTPKATLERLSRDVDRRVAAQACDMLIQQQEQQKSQNEQISQPLSAIDLSPVITELTRRLRVEKDPWNRSLPSLLMPWHLAGTVWWDLLPFKVRLGTTSFENPFHVPLPEFSNELLMRLAGHPDPEVRCLVARNPAAPVALLCELACDTSAQVRYSAAMNPSTPDALQKKLASALAKDEDWFPCPRGMEGCPIEQDPGSGPEFLRTLARRNNASGCKWVALNPSLPEDCLVSTKLTVEERDLVARNPSTPQKLLLKWAKDSESREEVAANPSLPQELLSALLIEAANSETLRFQLALNPALPVAYMRELASDDDELVRSNLAKNPALPAELMLTLSKDKDLLVRQALVSNPSTPWEILLALLGDKSKTVSDSVSCVGLYERQLHHALRDAVGSATPPERLQELASRGPWVIRLAAVRNHALALKAPEAHGQALAEEIIHAIDATDDPAIGTNELRAPDLVAPLKALGLLPHPSGSDAAGEAATSTDWLRRGAVALSDDVQPWILRRLLDDEVNVVRQLALWRLQRLTLQEGARSDCSA